MTNSKRQIIVECEPHFATTDHPFQTTAHSQNSTWQQQMNNAQDSLPTNSHGIPSLLNECFIRNQNNSVHQQNGAMSHFNGRRHNSGNEIGNVWTSSRTIQRRSKGSNLDTNSGRPLGSSGYNYPTINNIYYQEEVGYCAACATGRYKSASRPIHRSQEEKDLLRHEEKIISTTECEYDLATWRMYDRIMKYRQKRPLPDRYYDEVNKVTSTPHDPNNSESTITTDMMPSDLTALTAGTNSTSSSPSLCDSPKFAALQHSKSRNHLPTLSNDLDPVNWEGELCGSGLSHMVVSDINAQLVHFANDDEESDDEYADMMMFDLEL